MNVKKIVKEWLEKNGYDGIYCIGECACLKNDLMPCDGYSADCKPGYKRDAIGEEKEAYDWMMEATKNEKEIKNG